MLSVAIGGGGVVSQEEAAYNSLYQYEGKEEKKLSPFFYRWVPFFSGGEGSVCCDFHCFSESFNRRVVIPPPPPPPCPFCLLHVFCECS